MLKSADCNNNQTSDEMDTEVGPDEGHCDSRLKEINDEKKINSECTKVKEEASDGDNPRNPPLSSDNSADNAMNNTINSGYESKGGRSRKRKQTHTVRLQHDNNDCEFIEMKIPVPEVKAMRDESFDEQDDQAFWESIYDPDFDYEYELINHMKDQRASFSIFGRLEKYELHETPPYERSTSSRSSRRKLYKGHRSRRSSKNLDMNEENQIEESKYVPREVEDLGKALGIPPFDLVNEKVEGRRSNIQQKVRRGGTISFSMLEEYDIHIRAEEYASTILPDQSFYSLGDEASREENIEKLKNSLLMEQTCQPQDIYPTHKRRRRSYNDMECFVHYSALNNWNGIEGDNTRVLPEGTRLLRPPNKLVELVAQAINDSPDGMLQVQQVYLVLQNKYPYFRYMDKESITSWRSSIRHALYQKWFRKIPFQTDLINCKGCYWAINRKQEPREWTMPPVNPCHSFPDCTGDLSVQDLEELAAIASILDNVDSPLTDSQDSLSTQAPSSPDTDYQLNVSADGSRQSSPCVLAQTQKDPDPMLTNEQREVYDPESPACGFMHSDPVAYDWFPCEDGGFHEKWVPMWEEYQASLAYHAPLLPPLCISYPTVPPMELSEYNYASPAPQQHPMYFPAVYS